MTKRLIMYTLGFFFLFSSLGYACPELNSLSKHRHHSSLDEMASDENPCQESDHDTHNPICYQILHDRIWYKSPSFSLDSTVSRVVFFVQEITSGYDASLVFFRTTVAPEFHPKPPLTLLYRILRV